MPMGMQQTSTMSKSRDDTVLGPHPELSLEDHSLQGMCPHIKGQGQVTKQSCADDRPRCRTLRTLHKSRGRRADLNACWRGHVSRGHEGVVQRGEGSSGTRRWLWLTLPQNSNRTERYKDIGNEMFLMIYKAFLCQTGHQRLVVKKVVTTVGSDLFYLSTKKL